MLNQNNSIVAKLIMSTLKIKEVNKLKSGTSKLEVYIFISVISFFFNLYLF